LCELLELLKAIESTFFRHSVRIADVVAHAGQHISYVVIASMEKAKVTERPLKCDGYHTVLYSHGCDILSKKLWTPM
jgi:hypothetical protein